MTISSRIAVLVATFVVPPAFAQSDNAPSTLECMQVAAAEAPPAPKPLPPRRSPSEAALRDTSCFIDLATTNDWARGTPTWVDVRSPAQTRAAKIPGALEIPLSDLPQKRFLATLPIVLVGTGFDEADLADTCRTLRESGFARVKLLRGGVRAWQMAGRPLATTGNEATLDTLAPVDFHAHVRDASWLVVGVGVARDESLPSTLVGLVRVDADAEPQKAIAAIEQKRAALARASGDARPALMVVVAADASSMVALRSEARRGRVPDVLFLDGGLAGYRRFLDEQQRVAASAGKPLVRPCGSV
jgi:rhodanese-related sulfurtransferase